MKWRRWQIKKALLICPWPFCVHLSLAQVGCFCPPVPTQLVHTWPFPAGQLEAYWANFPCFEGTSEPLIAWINYKRTYEHFYCTMLLGCSRKAYHSGQSLYSCLHLPDELLLLFMLDTICLFWSAFHHLGYSDILIPFSFSPCFYGCLSPCTWTDSLALDLLPPNLLWL